MRYGNQFLFFSYAPLRKNKKKKKRTQVPQFKIAIKLDFIHLETLKLKYFPGKWLQETAFNA